MEDCVPFPRSLGRGKWPRSTYIANFDDFLSSYQGYDAYDNHYLMSPNFHPGSKTSYYSGADGHASAETYMTNNIENMHFKEEYKSIDQLIIGNGKVFLFLILVMFFYHLELQSILIHNTLQL